MYIFRIIQTYTLTSTRLRMHVKPVRKPASYTSYAETFLAWFRFHNNVSQFNSCHVELQCINRREITTGKRFWNLYNQHASHCRAGTRSPWLLGMTSGLWSTSWLLSAALSPAEWPPADVGRVLINRDEFIRSVCIRGLFGCRLPMNSRNLDEICARSTRRHVTYTEHAIQR